LLLLLIGSPSVPLLEEMGRLNQRDIKSALVYAHLDLDPTMRNVDHAAGQMLSVRKRDDASEAPTSL